MIQRDSNPGGDLLAQPRPAQRRGLRCLWLLAPLVLSGCEQKVRPDDLGHIIYEQSQLPGADKKGKDRALKRLRSPAARVETEADPAKAPSE